MENYLSIIIPIYNVEEYIEQALNSIFAQSIWLDKIEVILVNDGSHDGSIQKAERIIKKYRNTTLINQENQGLSIARNNGFKESTGDYVWFVDSDDYILPQSLGVVFSAIKSNPDADVFASFLEVHDESGRWGVYLEKEPLHKNLSGREYLASGYPQGAIQRFIFKRSFLEQNHLKFYPGILHEDDLFGFKMLYLAKHIVVLPHPVYAYRTNRGGSIMQARTMKTPRCLIFIHKELKKFMNEQVEEQDREMYQIRIYNEIINYFRFCPSLWNTNEYKDYYQECKSYIKQETKFLLHKRSTFVLGMKMMFFPVVSFRIERWARLVYQKLRSWL